MTFGPVSRLLPFICCVWLAGPLPALASNPLDLAQAAREPQWLTLGHYQQTLAGGWVSQADDPAFFLAAGGAESPRAELAATIAALQQTQDPQSPDSHAACRFPARRAWIERTLGIEAAPVTCPALENWLDQLNTESVTLVFAASYLNSPSSMFGHTFLRLDPPAEEGRDNLLLAHTVSYAADAAEHDNELLFAYRGIFGGYPGITAIEPYYEKIRLYSDIENRDLWEYRLNLTPTEVQRLLWHTWELKDIRFDYYFFDENCASRLLELIDVARPGTRLQDHISTHAIPSDTVRWVVDADLVESVQYRGSTATTVKASLAQLTERERATVSALVFSKGEPPMEQLDPLPEASRLRVLDVAYDYLRYKREASDWPRERAAPLSLALLKARSRLEGQSGLRPPPVPEVRDDQGHDTYRLSLSGGHDNNRDFIGLTWRPAYHDLLDPLPGYRPGAQLQFLRVDARFYPDDDELQLEQLIPVEIRSLSPRDQFFQPLSWQVGFGLRRIWTEDSGRELAGFVDGGAGVSYSLAGVLVSALANGALEAENNLDKGWNAAPGAELQFLHQGQHVSARFALERRWWLVGGVESGSLIEAEARMPVGKSWSAGALWSLEERFDRYDAQWSVELHRYF